MTKKHWWQGPVKVLLFAKPAIVFLFLLTAAAFAEWTAQSSPGPDRRFKADILLIFAHPDDETGDVAAYLARAVFDEHRRVAVVCATRGEGGGNDFGPENGKALRLVREIEARDALSSLGISRVWYLNAPNGSQIESVLESLERWDHASLLEDMVRIIRLTRPEVIITWLPMVVAGENHPEHQASSVIAIEALDLAGDPHAFSEQLYASQSNDDSSLLVEGLKPWQTKKLYFYTDIFENRSGQHAHIDPSPFRKNYLLGVGPAYSSKDVSPSKHSSYARLSAEEASLYLSQEGDIGRKALQTSKLDDFEDPTFFVFGKSLVQSDVTSDIFQGITNETVPFSPVQRTLPDIPASIVARLGGPWAFYDQFWGAHGLQHLSNLLPVPEIAAHNGARIHVPILISNDTARTEDVVLRAILPQGWTNKSGDQTYTVRAHDSYSVDSIVISPTTITNPWQELKWEGESNGKSVGRITLRVNVRKPRSD